MTVPEIKRLIEDVTCEDFEILVVPDDNFCFLQVECMEDCVRMDCQLTVVTWRLAPWMTKSEIVHSVFKCCLASVEHRIRESFQYKGERVYGPHFDVDSLHELASQRRLDLRPE